MIDQRSGTLTDSELFEARIAELEDLLLEARKELFILASDVIYFENQVMPDSIVSKSKQIYSSLCHRGMVEIDVTPYLGKTEKINVTLPGNLVRQIDGYVQKHGLKSRSSFLAEAALDKVTGRA